MKPSENLTVLANRIAEPGAWKCGSQVRDGAGCLLVHLALVLGLPLGQYGKYGMTVIPYDDLNLRPETHYLAKVTGRRQCPSFTEMIWQHNDDDGRTQEQCVDLCHRAARLAKEAGE